MCVVNSICARVRTQSGARLRVLVCMPKCAGLTAVNQYNAVCMEYSDVIHIYIMCDTDFYRDCWSHANCEIIITTGILHIVWKSYPNRKFVCIFVESSDVMTKGFEECALLHLLIVCIWHKMAEIFPIQSQVIRGFFFLLFFFL